MLGPPDGRYLVREALGDGEPQRVLVVRQLNATEARLLPRRRRARPADPEPDPAPVPTVGATVIELEDLSEDQAKAWLEAAGDDEVDAALRVVNEAIRGYRLATGDAHLREAARDQALVVRAGYGEGERVADGRWNAALELPPPKMPRVRRASALRPQERLAALLGGREQALACEELTLRARIDFDAGREREAAFQLMAALDAALRELAGDQALAQRMSELDAAFKPVADAAAATIGASLGEDDRDTIQSTLRRLEAAIRARGANSA